MRPVEPIISDVGNSSHPLRRSTKSPSTWHFLTALNVPLFAALVFAKALACGTWQWWSIRFPFKLALVAFNDLVAVLVWAAFGALVLILTRRRLRLQRLVRVALAAASVFIVVFGVANVWIYSALRMPLTYPL